MFQSVFTWFSSYLAVGCGGGGGGGLPQGIGTQPATQLFTLGSSKIEVFETCFYDILITQNDHPRYAKHV